MTDARFLWRVEIPGRAGEPPYRLGVLIEDPDRTGDTELTVAWVKDTFKHLKLERVVEIVETSDFVDVRSVASKADRAALPPARMASALSASWRKAGRPAGARFKLDGEELPAAGRASGINVQPMRIVGSTALAKSILEKNRPVQAALVQSLRSTMGVIPFVGAGLSAAFDFPQWGDLLRRLAGPAQKKGVERHLRENAYEQAAQGTVRGPECHETGDRDHHQRSSDAEPPPPGHCTPAAVSRSA